MSKLFSGGSKSQIFSPDSKISLRALFSNHSVNSFRLGSRKASKQISQRLRQPNVWIQNQKSLPLYVFDILAIVLHQEQDMLQNGFLDIPNAGLNHK